MALYYYPVLIESRQKYGSLVGKTAIEFQRFLLKRYIPRSVQNHIDDSMVTGQQPSIQIKKETFSLICCVSSKWGSMRLRQWYIVNEGAWLLRYGIILEKRWCTHPALFKLINTQDRALRALPARRSFAAPLSSSHSRIWGSNADSVGRRIL